MSIHVHNPANRNPALNCLRIPGILAVTGPGPFEACPATILPSTNRAGLRKVGAG
jgi:hypothetical protein